MHVPRSRAARRPSFGLSPVVRSLLTAAALIVLVAGARVRYTGSDARVTLLTAQALLETGSPRLDPYLSPEVERDIGAPWTIWHHQGVRYGYYPLGSAILAMPAVELARAVGLDMVRAADDARVQIALAALLVAAIFLVLEQIARLFLPPDLGWICAVVFVLGTSLTSTVGTALWSHGPLVALTALATWRVGRASLENWQVNGAWLGLLLGAAYWCRPTAVIPALLLALLLCFRARREAVRFVVAVGLVALALVVASLLELGRPLPAYYDPRSFPTSATPAVGLLGVLASPGRGLFLFSPILLLGLWGWWSARLRRDPLYLLCNGWIGLQVLLVARNADWWGGWSYGPRLLTDCLPAWFVLVVLSLAELRLRPWRPATRNLGVAVIAVAAAFSVGVHSVQGLYNPATVTWNDRPNVYDDPVGKLFAARYPQFLATWQRNEAFTRRLELDPER